MKLYRRIRTLLYNLAYLSRKSMEDSYWDMIQISKIAIEHGRLLYHQPEKSLNILNSKETLELLINNPKSFYRFGDGEINIINGGSAGTQKYDPKLSKKLREALVQVSDNAYIGIGYDYFDFNLWDESDFSNRFYLLNATKYREFYLKNCHKDVTYIDTGFSQKYFNLLPKERDEWFSKVKKLFTGKDVVVFMGEKAYNNLSYYVFDEANSLDYVFCPSKNAFDIYDDLLLKAREFSRDKILCFAIGATSKALIYELSKEGYLAYDIGHLPKDYDTYMKKIEITADNAENFYLDDYKLR